MDTSKVLSPVTQTAEMLVKKASIAPSPPGCVDISGITSVDDDAPGDFENLGDSLTNAFTLDSENATFTTKLPTKLFVGGTFKVNEKLDIGVLNKVQFSEAGSTTNMFMLSANSHFSNKLSITGSYAVTKDSYDNLGLGIAVRAGFAQFVLGTGNVFRLFSIDKAKYTSVRFGINFMFGKLQDQDAIIGKNVKESL